MPDNPAAQSPFDQEVIAAIQRETMPFVDDPPYAAGFYDAMGRMVLMWGRLEQELDNLLIAAIVVAKKSTGETHEMYISLSRKLKLLKLIYRSCEELMPLYGSVTTIASDIKKNGDNRSFVIHASWTGFQDGNPPKLTMQHLSHETGTVTVSKFGPTISDLSKLCANFHLCRAKILYVLFATDEISKKVQGLGGAQARHSPPNE